MKKLLPLFSLYFSLLTFYFAHAQNVGIGTNTPNASAQLDVTSTNKGFLPPRMTYVQRIEIVNPVAGLIVYCTDCGQGGQLSMFDGINWKAISSISNSFNTKPQTTNHKHQTTNLIPTNKFDF
jgi:hypothetical protein